MRVTRAIAAGTGVVLLAILIGGFVILRQQARHQLYYGLMYAVAARQATAGASNQQQQIERLAQFVSDEVHTPDDAPLDEDGPPAETLLYAYGFCDQQVRLFMQMAQSLGFNTREFFL